MTMLAMVLSALLARVVDGASLRARDRFHDYMATYGRQYEVGSQEYAARRALFERRDQEIEAHNGRVERLWTAGHNHLTDRTTEELNLLRGWRRVGTEGGTRMSLLSRDVHIEKMNATLPSQVDWRQLKSMQLTFDQGGCGSCWAVTTAAMLAANYELHSKDQLVKHFSPQQFVDCVPNPKECGGPGGCSGATVELGLAYAAGKGLDNLRSLRDYSYVGTDQPCDPSLAVSPANQVSLVGATSCSAQGIKLAGWTTLPKNKALPLMQHLVHGPVGVSVGADTWFNYLSGIFDSCTKDVVVDHAVLLVGYGSDMASGRNVNYWTIKNSWGDRWGEHGHIRVLRHGSAREDDAHCGEDNDPKAGVACKPYPDKDTVCGVCGILYDSVATKFERCSTGADSVVR